MSRDDVRTFAWLVPLALVLVTWWLFRADTCLDTEISNVWHTWFPPVAEHVPPSSDAPGAVSVENPYGISSCHHFPGALGKAITYTILALIALFIGFLCARNFRQRARTCAAAITFGTLSIALAFNLLVYLPGNLYYFERENYRPLIFAAFYLLPLASGAGALAWLAAWLTMRWGTRG
jgi:hypothetical protein